MSLFHRIDEDHESLHPQCLSRARLVEPDQETIREFFDAAVILLTTDNAETPLPAVFLTRQMVELSLKALISPDKAWGHDLGCLLKKLEDRGDDLFASTEPQVSIVEFIRDLNNVDKIGDEFRYPKSSGGRPALEHFCCTETPQLLSQIDRVYEYVERRLRT